MAENDNDMELLHEYVDGELPMSDCEGLWRRLAIERELMGELDRLRADHAVRTMVWSSLEPDESTVARLQAKVMRATRREDFNGEINIALPLSKKRNHPRQQAIAVYQGMFDDTQQMQHK